MLRTFASIVTMVLALAVAPAHAEGAATGLVQKYLSEGAIGPKEEALVALAAKATGDADAQLGLGLIRSARAFEHLAQALYKHGFGARAVEYGVMWRNGMGSLGYNRNPEPITYQQFRDILQNFVNDLSASEAALAEVGDRPAKIVVDLSKTHFDWNGDGKVSPEDHFGRFISDLDEKGEPKPFIVGFDTADAMWLRGYDNLLMGVAKAWLSHDFSETWDTSFGVVFPKMQTTMSAASEGPPDQATALYGFAKRDADNIADFISLIHTIRWPVADKAMWLETREHFRKVIQLNRETWRLVRAETDDDHEWLPGPHQKSGVLPSLPVTDERIDAWLTVLTHLEETLDGKKLAPHWRLNKGVNIARVFEDPRPFDFVLWVTGPAALPYLQDGPVLTSEEWGQVTRMFGGDFFTYAFYFN